MSTSAKAIKPKRPLSGYNLFYRYKRIKVVEATARSNVKDDDHNKAVIHRVLTALPGLEDVPPVFPLFDLPPARLNEFRAANIRCAMQGKLSPNENAKNRLHCKVHGMGFVEMGRVMRQMWGRADKFTKDVFMDLAEVGRARYRILMAEWRLSGERPENVTSATPDYQVNKSAAAAFDPTTTEARAKAEASETSPIPQRAGSSSDPRLEAPLVWATKNTPAGAAGARPSCGRRVSFRPSEAQSYGPGRGSSFEPLAFGTTIDQRQVSVAAELDLCNESLFEPLPVEKATGTALIDAFKPPPFEANNHSAASKTSNGHARRVSTDITPQLNWRAMMGNGAMTGNGTWTPKTSSTYGRQVSSDGSTGSNLELNQFVLTNAIKNLKDRIIQNNSLLPSDLRVFPEEAFPQAQENKVRAKPRLEVMTSGGPSILSRRDASDNNANPRGGSSLEKREVSAQGSAEFTDELTEAIDSHGIVVGARDKPADVVLKNHRARMASFWRCSGAKPAPPPKGTVPVPAGVELKNHRARTA